ncbi:MAG: transketolase [Gammaproteobacteria bacterium]
MTNVDWLAAHARRIRVNVIRQAMGKGEGYVGQGLQCADVFAALFFHEMRLAPDRPDDPDRDRFLLSVGHYAIALYAALAELGLLDADMLRTYGADGSPLTLGAEPGHLPGVEFAGGSLGQGLGVAAGLALGLRMRGSPARVFNYMSDGELQEGSTWEAAMFAADRGLAGLVNVIDVNRTQADGALGLEVEPVARKFESFGWWAQDVDGNDLPALLQALDAARAEAARPKALVCHTRLSHGSPTLMARGIAHFVRVGREDWETIMREVAGAP